MEGLLRRPAIRDTIARTRTNAALARIEGMDTVIKADPLVATLNRGADTRNPAVIAEMMSTGTQRQRVRVRPGPACSYDGAAIARHHLNC